MIFIVGCLFLGAVQVSCDRSRGEGGVPQMLTFAHKGGRGGTANDHSIMIMHWGGGGRSHNDHLITLLIFGQELQKRTNLYILSLVLDSNMFLHNN